MPPPADTDLPSTPVSQSSRPIHKVVIYGGNGAFGAVTAEALARDHVLRVTSRRPTAQVIAENKPQNPGAPLPRLLDAPHEMRVVDITDPKQVLDAARGMDAIVNCTVIRPHPVEAFRVNMLGAYNVMRAAVECGIRRVVHTGPVQILLAYPAGYWYDFGVVDDVPPRPGADLYITTKFLGQEICRVFAEGHGLEVPALLWTQLVNPDYLKPNPTGGHPFTTSWYDTGEAIRQAVRVPSFPHPFEIIHVVADLPQGKYSNEKAKRLLAWQPRERLEKSRQRVFD